MENREKVTITGVVDVDSFDEASVVLVTDYGFITLHGRLHINKLNLRRTAYRGREILPFSTAIATGWVERFGLIQQTVQIRVHADADVHSKPGVCFFVDCIYRDGNRPGI